MIIRYYKNTDEDQIQELAKKNGILVPEEGLLIVAEDNSGKIVGFINLRYVPMIEPLICGNPLAGRKLLDEAEMILKVNNQQVMRAIVGDEVRDLAVKDGFYEVFIGKNIVEKFIPPMTDEDLKKIKQKSLLKNTNIN